ncbi:MAG: hypothetical protein AB1779_04685 [Candidatus Thermoplasmatota archaeon]
MKETEEISKDKNEELRAMVKELLANILENDGKISPKCTRCLLLLERIGMVLRMIGENERKEKLTLEELRPTVLPAMDRTESMETSTHTSDKVEEE